MTPCPRGRSNHQDPQRNQTMLKTDRIVAITALAVALFALLMNPGTQRSADAAVSTGAPFGGAADTTEKFR